MAVESTLISSTAVMKVKTGTKNGKDVFRKENINNINPLAKDEDVFAVVESFKGIIDYNVIDINRENLYELSKAE
ncbi:MULTISPECIES: DUF1659 domain-containing protein [Clostridium]|nr:DUF1659 domain-containing protein [Clostridium cadaveris]MDU4951754.1 DUF1659 domain-containing protein [Clostridium sp.]MDM8312644.1 DUF1659 domain-containing protein [Clostridium cadaveris]MDY4949379.1 DUF1659 domain-containing protein [Clostridium cadaveris]NME64766.1 DUF1659 domain-containing protein [Clostridium cadaveris]NWK12357.1 DUF1659 domain-containing protein [Clostridium cadaveris]